MVALASNTSTEQPARASVIAAARPFGPLPTITASNSAPRFLTGDTIPASKTRALAARNRGVRRETNHKMSKVQVYGCNHVALEVRDIKKAVAFYEDVFNLQKLDSGEGDAFFKLGEHQFLALFETKNPRPSAMQHFGIMVRDEDQLAEV